MEWNGDKNMIACEHCTEDIASVEEAHSMLVVLQKVNKDTGYSWFQCEQGSLVDGHNWQHWHCGRSALREGVARCIGEHYMESDLIPVPTTQVRFHKRVLNAGLICKVCQEKLTDTAYRFCLTHATPFNWVPDDSHNDLGEWCCSLEHARQNALATIASIQ